jgi:hypothetical protein
MGVFEEFAPLYWELGISALPAARKLRTCVVPEWSKWCERLPTEQEEKDLLLAHANDEISIACGPASNLIALDIDLPADNPLTIELESMLPPIYIAKQGRPGRAPCRFYTYNDEPSRKFDKIHVEILSKGRNTVIPPSYHILAKKNYEWISTNLLEANFLCIPALPLTVIPWLEQKESQAKGIEVDNSELTIEAGRCKHGSHNFMSSLAMKLFSKDCPFPYILKSIIAKDKEINREADYLYFQCPTRRWRHKTPEKNAETFLYEIFDRHVVKKAETTEGNKKGLKVKYKDFEKFFDKHLAGAKKDILSDTPLIRDRHGKECSVPNMVKALRSHSIDEGYQDSKVEYHLDRYLRNMEPELILDIPEWDGRDHVGEMFSHIALKEFNNMEAAEIFKEWGANLFRRLYNPLEQNRLIIFKGKQGEGKDTLVHHLLKGFGRYFKNMSVSKRVEENYQVMSQALCLNIAEFDQTARVDVSTLKDIITKDSGLFRKPYARAPEDEKFHCSFVSTCNIDDILRDYTGNRRFVIFEVLDIDWDYPKDRSLQVVAQFNHLYKTNFRCEASVMLKMKSIIEQLTPQDPGELFFEDYVCEIDNRALGSNVEYKLKDIESLINNIAKRYGFTTRQALNILRRKKMSFRRGGQTLYSSKPPELHGLH